MQKDRYQKIIGIFILFAILLNFPFIGIFSKAGRIWGLPTLYAYIFSMWFLLIALMYWMVERKK